MNYAKKEHPLLKHLFLKVLFETSLALRLGTQLFVVWNDVWFSNRVGSIRYS